MPNISHKNVIQSIQRVIRRGSILSIFIAAVTIFIYLNHEPNAETTELLNGTVVVHDGDTVTLDGKKIRLQGIDAPELSQNCELPIGEWKCGEDSKKKLSEIVKGKAVSCTNEGTDRYKRQIGICYIDNLDINAYMVKNGYAIAYVKYTRKYADHETYARKNKLGLWRSKFQSPENFRRSKQKNTT